MRVDVLLGVLHGLEGLECCQPLGCVEGDLLEIVGVHRPASGVRAGCPSVRERVVRVRDVPIEQYLSGNFAFSLSRSANHLSKVAGGFSGSSPACWNISCSSSRDGHRGSSAIRRSHRRCRHRWSCRRPCRRLVRGFRSMNETRGVGIQCVDTASTPSTLLSCAAIRAAYFASSESKGTYRDVLPSRRSRPRMPW